MASEPPETYGPSPSSTPSGGPPQVSPPNVGVDHSFTLQAIYDLKGCVSSLETKVEALKDASDKQTTSIDRIKVIIAGATGALIIIGLVAGYIFNNRFDQIMSLLTP